jgi:hypothetical protein
MLPGLGNTNFVFWCKMFELKDKCFVHKIPPPTPKKAAR